LANSLLQRNYMIDNLFSIAIFDQYNDQYQLRIIAILIEYDNKVVYITESFLSKGSDNRLTHFFS
jgi:hypothetical protein